LQTVIEVRYVEHTYELDIALNTGLRLSEMYGLTWENVNLDRRVLVIPRSKNGDTRHVPINVTALAALSELQKRGDGTGAVIRNLQGMPLTDPRHWFEAAIRTAKIRGFSWHCWPPSNGSQATSLRNQLAPELAPPSIYRLQRALAECNKSLIVMVF